MAAREVNMRVGRMQAEQAEAAPGRRPCNPIRTDHNAPSAAIHTPIPATFHRTEDKVPKKTSSYLSRRTGFQPAMPAISAQNRRPNANILSCNLFNSKCNRLL